MTVRCPRTPAWVAIFLLVSAVTRAGGLPSAAQIADAFRAIDTTGNKAISALEWETASFALFHATDKNNNNFLDPGELPRNSPAEDTFLRADTDRDGRLSVGEFMELRRSLFRIADLDHNEFLTPTEFHLFILFEHIGWQDRNQNGRIEVSEFTASLRRAFPDLDADHDGLLSPAEAPFLSPENFRRADANGDAQLSPDELIADYRSALFGG
jgi:Ca2+-binding EF-hand superfamily protein